MPSENDELLARISQLAGQINRHKAAVAAGNPSSSSAAAPPPPRRHQPYPPPGTRGGYGSNSWAPNRGASSYRGAPSYRGRGRGGRMPTAGHRNHTLVLNKPTSSSSPASGSDTPNNGMSDEPMPDAGSVAPQNAAAASNGGVGAASWVAKRDRSTMQLINTSVYDKKEEARRNAIEKTRQDKLKQREEREKAKLRNFLKGTNQYNVVDTPGNTGAKSANVATYQHEVVINGARYKITVNGSKLVKVSDDAKKPTPKTAVVGGVTFHRSKGGNLWREGVVRKNQRHDDRSTQIKKIAKPCKFFTIAGKCGRGNTCPYIHDPDRVAICPKFLQNSCPDGDSCDLSHVPNPHRVPACDYFGRGVCTNDECKYAHVRVNPSAPICRPFAKEGYCDKGADCKDKHLVECPDFDKTGVCNNKACKLPHIEHAGRRRAQAARAAAGNESDISSDEDKDDEEEDQIYSDDVDSDYFSDNEVILGNSAGDDGHEVSQQADFIRF